MSASKPLEILAKIPNTIKRDSVRSQHINLNDDKNLQSTIQVSASAENELLPDIIFLDLKISSKKKIPAEAKHSVNRRLDYILQILNNNKIKENYITTNSLLIRLDGGFFQMTSEISAKITDFSVYHSICNFLNEKLDDVVLICPPRFCHSFEKSDDMRQDTYVKALNKCKKMVERMAGLVNMRVGMTISIQEKCFEEWIGNLNSTNGCQSSSSLTFQKAVDNFTLHNRVELDAVFQLTGK